MLRRRTHPQSLLSDESVPSGCTFHSILSGPLRYVTGNPPEKIKSPIP